MRCRYHRFKDRRSRGRKKKVNVPRSLTKKILLNWITITFPFAFDFQIKYDFCCESYNISNFSVPANRTVIKQYPIHVIIEPDIAKSYVKYLHGRYRCKRKYRCSPEFLRSPLLRIQRAETQLDYCCIVSILFFYCVHEILILGDVQYVHAPVLHFYAIDGEKDKRSRISEILQQYTCIKLLCSDPFLRVGRSAGIFAIFLRFASALRCKRYIRHTYVCIFLSRTFYVPYFFPQQTALLREHKPCPNVSATFNYHAFSSPIFQGYQALTFTAIFLGFNQPGNHCQEPV